MKGFDLIWFFVFHILFSTDARNIEPRIINGQDAFLGQFPWQAALFFYGGPDLNAWFCSGAIINSEWILTAAHCTNRAISVQIFTGTVDISSYESTQPTSVSSDFIMHEEFGPSSLAHDIALIKLPEPLEFDENTKPILLSTKDVEVGTIVTVSGWGQTDINDTRISPFLHYLNLVTISNKQCQDLYGTTGKILSGMVCAATNSRPIQSPCHGDSGGPVVVGFDTDTPLHVAVASFVSDRGCESGYPSGYTRTAVYREWIKKKTGI